MSDPSSPISICIGGMSLGNVMSQVNMSIVRQGVKAKSAPSKVYVSDAPMAIAPAANNGINGCGTWVSHVLKAKGLEYAIITNKKVYGREHHIRQIALRIVDSAPIIVLHAIIPKHPSSSIIDGKVPVFTGRADILSFEEVTELELPIREEQFMDMDGWDQEVFICTQLNTTPNASGRVSTVSKVKSADGKITEVTDTRQRRRIRIRD